MKVNRQEMYEALRRVVAVVDPQNPQGVFQNVCFTDGMIQGSDGVLGVVTKAPQLERPFCIAGDWLLHLLRKLTCEEVELSADGTNLLVKAGRHTSKTPTIDAVRFPNLLIGAGTMLPVHCGAGLERALVEVLSLTSEAKQQHLQGIGFWKNFVYASDGDRATRCSWGGHVPEPIVIPRAAASTMSNYGDPKTMRIGAKQESVLVTYDGFVVTSRVLASKLPFMAIDQMIDKRKADSVDVQLPEDFSESVDRVRLMGGEGGVKVTSSSGLLSVMQEKASCLSEEVLDVPGAPHFCFVSRPNYLLDALKRTNACDVGDVIRGDKRLVRFFLQEGALEVQHLMCLVV